MQETRRGLAGLIAKALLALSALMSGAAGWRIVRRQPVIRPNPVHAGKVSQVEPPQAGHPVAAVAYEPSSEMFLVRTHESLAVASARCTHQFCLLRFEDAGQMFVCPCHGSLYDAQGKVLRGPASTPMRWFRPHVTAGGDIHADVAVSYDIPIRVPVEKPKA